MSQNVFLVDYPDLSVGWVKVPEHFLAQRRQRRTNLALSADLIAYEQQGEWLEGLAKYVELAILRQAAGTEEYNPLPVMNADPDFHDYSTVERHWSQEIAQIRRMANDEGDGRFYYSDMAQAILRDQFLPGRKERIVNEEVQLEELLAEASSSAGICGGGENYEHFTKSSVDSVAAALLTLACSRHRC